ncbi:MAG: hypothetical protein HYS13_09290 [Planctomycetia bacterium]|nr:hypothetical protein [Planctomycetia bacterium]
MPRLALDFGEVWVTPDFRWKLPVRNLTDRPVEVVGVESSCTCTVAEPRKFTVPARGVCELELRLNLAAADRQDAASALRGVAVEVAPIVKALPEGMRAPRWRITGKVRSPFLFTPTALSLGEVAMDDPAPAAHTVRVECLWQVSDLQAHCHRDDGEVRLRKLADRPGDYELTVVPRSFDTPGYVEFFVTLTGTLADGSSMPAIPYQVAGQVVPDVRAEPSIIIVTGAPGERFEREVSLVSRTGRGFVVVDSSCAGESLKITPAGESPGRAVYKLTGAIEATQFKATPARFQVRSQENGEAYDVSVTVVFQPQTETRHEK